MPLSRWLNVWRTSRSLKPNNPMKNQHTPGPWAADKFSRGDDYTPTNCRVTSGKKEIACAFYGATDGEREANARLIAAAPELLAALEGLLDAYAPRAGETAKNNGEESLHCSVREARAAIAKAKGQP